MGSPNQAHRNQRNEGVNPWSQTAKSYFEIVSIRLWLALAHELMTNDYCRVRVVVNLVFSLPLKHSLRIAPPPPPTPWMSNLHSGEKVKMP